MKYRAWVEEVVGATEEPGVLTMQGQVLKSTYTYSLKVNSEGLDHPSMIAPFVLTIRSAEKLNWRAGQNIDFSIHPLEKEFEEVLDNAQPTVIE